MLQNELKVWTVRAEFVLDGSKFQAVRICPASCREDALNKFGEKFGEDFVASCMADEGRVIDGIVAGIFSDDILNFLFKDSDPLIDIFAMVQKKNMKVHYIR
jgi:hypothetical protein